MSRAACIVAHMRCPANLKVGRVGGIKEKVVELIEELADDDDIVVVDYTVDWTDHGRSWEEDMLSPDQQLQLPVPVEGGKRVRTEPGWHRLGY